MRGSLDELIPEYEIVDGLGNTRFLDHALIRFPLLADIELDGYGAHQKNASQWTFADDRRRDAGMRMIGWEVLRFAYSDIKNNPLACQQLLKRWLDCIAPKASLLELRIEQVKRMSKYVDVFTLGDVMKLLYISEHPARQMIKVLLERNIIVPCGTGRHRVRAYKRNEEYFRRHEFQKIKF